MAVSGEFRYFGCWSASIARAPKATTDPESRQMGIISRFRNRSMRVAALALHDEAAAHEQRERKPLLEQVRLQRLA